MIIDLQRYYYKSRFHPLESIMFSSILDMMSGITPTFSQMIVKELAKLPYKFPRDGITFPKKGNCA